MSKKATLSLIVLALTAALFAGAVSLFHAHSARADPPVPTILPDVPSAIPANGARDRG
jgi:hypothetical protein